MLVEKKLRDVTKEEFKEWVSRTCGKIMCKDCPFITVNCGAYSTKNWIDSKDIFKDDFLNKKIPVKLPDLLDEVEKKYLANIIKPFRDKVIKIRKEPSCYYMSKARIGIDTPGMTTWLPYFNARDMYVNMENNTNYTLEELGL